MIHLAGTLAVILSFLTHPMPSRAADSTTDGPAPDQGVVTREWSWTDDDGVTVLTVRGPAEQVAGFEPGDPPSQCPDCILMSSTAFEAPEGDVAVPYDADQPTKASASHDR